jgi:hypothetical protein
MTTAWHEYNPGIHELVRKSSLCELYCCCMQTNKRGKVSSRPGPGWEPAPEAIQQQVQLQQQAPAQPQASAAAAAFQQQQQPAVQQQQQQSPPRGGQQLQETPQVVVDRMFKRVITFAGLPVVTGMLLFPVFWYLRVSD